MSSAQSCLMLMERMHVCRSLFLLVQAVKVALPTLPTGRSARPAKACRQPAQRCAARTRAAAMYAPRGWALRRATAASRRPTPAGHSPRCPPRSRGRINQPETALMLCGGPQPACEQQRAGALLQECPSTMHCHPSGYTGAHRVPTSWVADREPGRAPTLVLMQCPRGARAGSAARRRCAAGATGPGALQPGPHHQL